jgi:hypothetical protein
MAGDIIPEWWAASIGIRKFSIHAAELASLTAGASPLALEKFTSLAIATLRKMTEEQSVMLLCANNKR